MARGEGAGVHTQRVVSSDAHAAASAQSRLDLTRPPGQSHAVAPAPFHAGAAMGLLRPLDAAGTGPEDGERRSLSPGKGHQIAASTGEIAEVARATGQGPGGRTSEEPTGAAGKSRDPASGGHVQNNWPTAL